MIYIREAHPEDGWQVPMNPSEGVVYRQHQSLEERTEVAQACSLNLKYSFPTLVDDMNNSTDVAYAASPERLYLVAKDGKIAYRGGPGPFMFDPDEWEDAIKKYLAQNPE